MPTLAELRQRPLPSRPTVPVDLCLDAALMDRIHDMESQRAALLDDATASRKPAGRAEIKALSDAIAAARDDMTAETGTLVLRANWSAGEWSNFVDANPPRTEGPAKERDERRTGGIVNADALADALATFAHTWDGDLLDAEAWEALILPRIWPGDLVEITQAIVSMYEVARDFRRARSDLSAALGRLSDSDEPEISASAPDATTAGSPDGSSEDSTATVNE